ncbi:MAG TPA: nickel transporter [Burkholderiaceae bacterium]|nr:nickel transporter [Burkholderiaceae bacterium]
MSEFPTSPSTLAAVVLLLGLRHGFDADHLAAIDGLTRCAAGSGKRFARYCGVLFSVGHGVVVLAVALLAGAATQVWRVPGWLELAGAWISIGVLTLLGALNLLAVGAADSGAVVALVGLKGRWVGALTARHPAHVALVGALFALSFDTFSQAALFAVVGSQRAGFVGVMALGALFMLGMVATDAINGFWMARMLARADALARIASRVMGLTVGLLSLVVAALGAARCLSPSLDGWSDRHALGLGAAVIAIVAIGAASGAAMSAIAARRPAKPTMRTS